MRSIMNVKTNQKGFTLIELVVVIVILGILAVTAVPKFMDISGDAKSSVVQAVKASVNSVADMAHAKALVSGTVSGDLSVAGSNVTFVNSYPNAASINALMDIESGVFTVVTSGSGTTFTHAKAATGANCVVTYNDAAADSKPAIAVDTDGC